MFIEESVGIADWGGLVSCVGVVDFRNDSGWLKNIDDFIQYVKSEKGMMIGQKLELTTVDGMPLSPESGRNMLEEIAVTRVLTVRNTGPDEEISTT